ncbi:MAG: glutathione S-transferase family protein [Proteobacteria bacterium]|nr:glutathione S-transferase family protein [Pseudomonadota bacterium]
MKLYSVNLSPYAARPRIAIYAKGLDVQIAPPPGGPGSDDYRAINPMGKVPCLVRDDGLCIPESDTIVEYFEDAFPDAAPLRPASAEDKAKARVLARLADLYVMAPMSKLFGQLNPAQRDQAVVDALLEEVEKGLDGLNVFLSDDGYAAGAGFSTADVQIAPPLFYLPLVAMAFGRDLLGDRPRLKAYAERLKQHPAVARAYGEMGEALNRYQTTGEVV